MRKKVLSVVLCGAMAATALAGCGGSSSTSSAGSASATTSAASSTTSAASSTTSAASSTTSSAASSTASSATNTADAGSPVEPDYGTDDMGSGDLKIWVADAVVDFTQQQLDQFKKDHSNYANWNFTIEPVGEGDAASNMLTDVEAGADVYAFPQDQLARLVAAGCLTPLNETQTQFVTTNNDEGSVTASTLAGTTYAYPITSDNGFFLMYDKSVVTDPSTLDAVVKSCEEAGKGFYMEINNGWYQPAFFFGAGCTLTYDTDETGNFTKCNMDYASENGVNAMKALIALHKSSAFNNGSAVDKATNMGAIVTGTWSVEGAKTAFGDNYACAKLPTFTCGGEQKQLSGFAGFKLLGVKPQTDATKLAVANAVAEYLSTTDVQVARYNAVSWGPSNKVAQQDSGVTSDVALTALADQIQYMIPQGQYPNDYWTAATSLGDSIVAGDYDNASDDDLMKALQDFQDTCVSYAGQ